MSSVGENVNLHIDISSDLRKPCWKTGKSLSYTEIFFLFIEKIKLVSNLNNVTKRNEKHPFTQIFKFSEGLLNKTCFAVHN